MEQPQQPSVGAPTKVRIRVAKPPVAPLVPADPTAQPSQAAYNPAASMASGKQQQQQVAVAAGAGTQPQVPNREDMGLLEDSDGDGPTLPSRRKAAGTGKRAAVILDDDEEEEEPAAQGLGSSYPSSKASNLAADAIYVADSDEEQVEVSRGSKKARLGPARSAGSAAPVVSARKQAAAAAAAAGAGTQARRPQRASRAKKAFGAEDSGFDPDDLEAAQELDDDDDFVDAGALDESDFEEDDMDMDVGAPGRARRGRGRGRCTGATARQGAGRRGKSKSGTPSLAELPDEDLGGDLMPVSMGQTDFGHLDLKADHAARPLWATPDGHIFLETFSPVYKQAQDFLVAIAEPVCRPEYVHEYQLTPHSLYAAVSVGLDTDTIISVLSRLSKVHLDEGLKSFIIAATKNYGKVKLVLKRNHFYVETSDARVFDALARDHIISSARVSDEVFEEKALKERAVAGITRITESELNSAAATTAPAAPHIQPTITLPSKPGQAPSSAANGMPAAAAAAAKGSISAAGFFGSACGMPEDFEGDEEDGEGEERTGGKLSIDDVEEGVDEHRVVRSFEIKGDMVETVKRRCLPGAGGLNYPMLEEYDFRNDRNTPDLNVELRPHVKLRPYQEKSLSKMFGNGRARSGIIVLPCGAGKSLVGVAAAARMRKSCLCLCTSSVSVDQWKHQFMLWTNLQDHQISRFTSDSKEQFAGVAGITITTFTMVAFSGKRSEESEKVMEAIRSREWGLLLMDEVHVVPAQMFRKVIGIIHSHCKLGLTATLVREDERIGDLNFLIGPKLYEANWLDLTRAGHIANVQCVEVWCPMSREFYKEYLKPENSNRRQLLYCMNPNKFMACQFLINWHEQVRKDKVIVFSDNIWALREYATRLGRPFIYGPTSHAERTRVLHAFKNDPNVNTVFLSKVGDNSLDIPEANVLIQISSHAGSRRQEAQRLGRILRAKRAKAGPSTEFNAFFYTLVSQDTQEMFYSTKRQQFLIDQGYAFKVVTNLVDTAAEAMAGQLMFSRKEEQLDLLCRVLVAGLEEAGVEVGAKDQEEQELDTARKKPGMRRAAGDMRTLTGAAGLRYMEYRAAAGPAEAFALPTTAVHAAGRGGGKQKQSETAKKFQRVLGITKK